MNTICITRLSFIISIMILVFSTSIIASPDNGNSAITTRLPNGLEVVMLENHSAPLVSVFVAIKAGAANETYKQNGLTHFLEHMLFNGTSKFTQKELYDEMDLIGGYNNAFTRKDFTVFTITTPTKFIERGMELQSGMLFDSTFPPEKVQKEIGIVSEEIRRDYSSPDQIMEDNFDAWVFKGTPYEKSILGSLAHIQSFTPEDVVQYWRTYYSPNNMTMVVVGDFKPSEMYSLIDKYYGQAMPADIQSDKLNFPGSISSLMYEQNTRKIDYIDGVTPSIRLVFNAPPCVSPEYDAFQLFTSILNDEINKYFENLNPSDPMSVYVSTVDTKMGSKMIISAEIPESMTYDVAEQQIHDAIEQSAKSITDPTALKALKTSSMASEIKLVENTMMFGMMSVGNAALWGWDWVGGRPDRIKGVEDSMVEDVRERTAQAPFNTYIALPFPESGKRIAKTKAQFVSETLDNGLTVAIKQDNASEIFGLHLLMKNRCYLEPSMRDGIADLLHRTLTAGTSKMSGEEIDQKLALLGMDFKANDWGFVPFDDYYLDPEFGYVRITGLDEYWKETIDLLAELISDDGITQEIFDSSRMGMLRELGPQMGMPGSVSATEFRNKIREGSKLARPIMGTMMTANLITLDDIKNFRKTFFSPGNMILTIATSEDPQSIMDEVKATFGKLAKVDVNPTISETVFKDYPGEEFIKELGSKQSQITLGFAVNGVDEVDLIPLYVLGGLISDRAAFDLRETQGLAYSIGASFNFYGSNGYFALRMGTGPENIDKAKTGIVNVLNLAKTTEFTQRDLDLAINSRTAQMIRYRIKRENQAYYMGYDLFKGEDPQRDPLEDWYKVTLSDIYRVRDRYFTPEKGFWSIVK